MHYVQKGAKYYHIAQFKKMLVQCAFALKNFSSFRYSTKGKNRTISRIVVMLSYRCVSHADSCSSKIE